MRPNPQTRRALILTLAVALVASLLFTGCARRSWATAAQDGWGTAHVQAREERRATKLHAREMRRAEKVRLREARRAEKVRRKEAHRAYKLRVREARRAAKLRRHLARGAVAYPAYVYAGPDGEVVDTPPFRASDPSYRAGDNHVDLAVPGAPELPEEVEVPLPEAAPLAPAPSLAPSPPLAPPAAAAPAPDAVNAVLAALNQERLRYGLHTLVADARLARAAAGHSAEMRALGYVDHLSPTAGRRYFTDRVTLAGVGSTGATAESIAAVTGPNDQIRRVLEQWLNDHEDRWKVLAEDFRYVGIGVVGDARGLHVTVIFAETVQ